MSLAELIRLCPPPESPCDAIYDENRVAEISSRYGLVFPADFFQIGATYGTGGFMGEDTHEIFIDNPFSRHFFLDVEQKSVIMSLFADSQIVKDQMKVQSIDSGSLFPFGRDTDDGYLFWITNNNPNLWKVMLIWYEREFFEVFNGPLSSFLVDYFSSRLMVQGWQGHLVEGRTQRYSFLFS